MVCGNIPYESNDQITSGELTFTDKVNISACLRVFIRSCLNISANDRIKLENLKKHPWMKYGVDLFDAEMAGPKKRKPLLMRARWNSSNSSNIPGMRNENLKIYQKLAKRGARAIVPPEDTAVTDPKQCLEENGDSGKPILSIGEIAQSTSSMQISRLPAVVDKNNADQPDE
jgi:hypothetical protein